MPKIKRYTTENEIATEDVIVGKANPDSTVAGIELHNDGELVVTRSGGNVAYINRLGNDGTVLTFAQSNITEGDISTNGSSLGLNATTTLNLQTAGATRANLNSSGLQLASGARVDEFATSITNDDTNVPTAGAVVDYATPLTDPRLSDSRQCNNSFDNATTSRANLGLGSLATLSSINNENWSGTDLSVANGGTGASDAGTARTNLGLGNHVTHNYGSTVSSVCEGNDTRLTNSRTCNNSFDNATTSRTNLGLGSLATLSSINNENWSGTDLSVANGGTGASDAGTARTNLGLGSLATLSSVNNENWSGTDLSVANGGTGASDAGTARTNLGLGTASTSNTTTNVADNNANIPTSSAVVTYVDTASPWDNTLFYQLYTGTQNVQNQVVYSYPKDDYITKIEGFFTYAFSGTVLHSRHFCLYASADAPSNPSDRLHLHGFVNATNVSYETTSSSYSYVFWDDGNMTVSLNVLATGGSGGDLQVRVNTNIKNAPSEGRWKINVSRI